MKFIFFEFLSLNLIKVRLTFCWRIFCPLPLSNVQVRKHSMELFTLFHKNLFATEKRKECSCFITSQTLWFENECVHVVDVVVVVAFFFFVSSMCWIWMHFEHKRFKLLLYFCHFSAELCKNRKRKLFWFFLPLKIMPWTIFFFLK